MMTEPIKCDSNGCPAVLMPSEGLPPTPWAEARRWRLIESHNGVGDSVPVQLAFCPEHQDLEQLTAVGGHTLHHARWDFAKGPKYRMVVLKADGTPIPFDEPLFLLRGRDPVATPTIRSYRDMARGILSARDLEQLQVRIQEFENYDEKRLPGSPMERGYGHEGTPGPAA